ncbi:Hypothetical protein, putative [Bodo saltans]|uniref:Zinc finger protein n=1 Tax=Bodo saltans TaxID=75058 RepID=A0A0S4KK17_BODSA|nr:Hypothetical protein, putative [Bodo saltans]|eukprot:CUI14901.1 Hypothetical protein, putative [Bodo saltans]
MEAVPRTPPPRHRPAAARQVRSHKLRTSSNTHTNNEDQHQENHNNGETTTPTVTPLSSLATPSRQVEHFIGIEGTPSHPSNAGTSPYYCPICMLHYPVALNTLCCGQTICGGCARGLFVQRGFLPPVSSSSSMPTSSSRPTSLNSSANVTPRPLAGGSSGVSVAHILSATPSRSSAQSNNVPADNLTTPVSSLRPTASSVRAMITATTERPVVPCPYCSRSLRAALQVSTTAAPPPPPQSSSSNQQQFSTVAYSTQTPRRPVEQNVATTPLPQISGLMAHTPAHRSTATSASALALGRSPYTPIASRMFVPSNTPQRHQQHHSAILDTQHPNAVPAAQQPVITKYASLKDLPTSSNSSPHVVVRHTTHPTEDEQQVKTSIGASFEELRARLVRFQVSQDYRRVEEDEVKHDPDRKKIHVEQEPPTQSLLQRPDYTNAQSRGSHRPTNRSHRRLNPAAVGSLRTSGASQQPQQNVTTDAAITRRSRSRSPLTAPQSGLDQPPDAEERSWCPIM